MFGVQDSLAESSIKKSKAYVPEYEPFSVKVIQQHLSRSSDEASYKSKTTSESELSILTSSTAAYAGNLLKKPVADTTYYESVMPKKFNKSIDKTLLKPTKS